MSAFSSWDTYNVIAEHIIETLQADTEFATSGSLEIQTWEAETRDPESYNDYELPAIAVEVMHSGAEINPLSKMTRAEYTAAVFTITGGQAVLQTAKQQAKRIAARVERALKQQNRPSKQLSDVTTDLEGAYSDSVRVLNVETLNDGGVIDNVLRGAATIRLNIEITFETAID
jgi:hypothetical protein